MKIQNLRPGQVWKDDTACLMISDVIVDDNVKIKGCATIYDVSSVNYSYTGRFDSEWTELPILIFNPPLRLWRPVGQAELDLILISEMKSFPPRLPDQPFFYPVLSEEYATEIAKRWNAPRGGGFVTEFLIDGNFIDQYEPQHAGGTTRQEYWIPAEDLEQFNAAIIGDITVIASF